MLEVKDILGFIFYFKEKLGYLSKVRELAILGRFVICQLEFWRKWK